VPTRPGHPSAAPRPRPPLGTRGISARGQAAVRGISARGQAAVRGISSHGQAAVRGISSHGQAAVELVALLPLLALLLALAYQALLAGQAAWEANVAARAAARANAVGADATGAARAHLPSGLEAGLKVQATPAGDVHVSVRIPRLLPALSLGRVTATAHFRPQSA
jgi:hypothetical protein